MIAELLKRQYLNKSPYSADEQDRILEEAERIGLTGEQFFKKYKDYKNEQDKQHNDNQQA
jgi:hypothetical protein